MLEIRNLSVAVKGKLLFQDFTLKLAPGEMTALCGPSGTGKTTLLRAVSGLIDSSTGDVLLNGRSREETGWPEFRRKVVFVSQSPVLLPGTVQENLALPFTYKTSTRKFSRREAASLLEAFGVSPSRLEQEASTLSQGQKQRVCIARALLVKPLVLLLDEPTGALDKEAVFSVEETLVEETRRRGLAALIVTHIIEQAKRLCDTMVNITDFGAVTDVC